MMQSSGIDGRTLVNRQTFVKLRSESLCREMLHLKVLGTRNSLGRLSQPTTLQNFGYPRV